MFKKKKKAEKKPIKQSVPRFTPPKETELERFKRLLMEGQTVNGIGPEGLNMRDEELQKIIDA